MRYVGITFEVATYASRVAKTGVLHGDAAKANVSPAKYAWTPENPSNKFQNHVLRGNDYFVRDFVCSKYLGGN